MEFMANYFILGCMFLWAVGRRVHKIYEAVRNRENGAVKVHLVFLGVIVSFMALLVWGIESFRN